MLTRLLVCVVALTVCLVTVYLFVREAKDPNSKAGGRISGLLLGINLLALFLTVSFTIFKQQEFTTSVVLICCAFILTGLCIASLMWLERIKDEDMRLYAKHCEQDTDHVIDEFRQASAARRENGKKLSSHLIGELDEILDTLHTAKESGETSISLQHDETWYQSYTFDTGNAIADAALKTKQAQLREKGIELRVVARIPERTPLQPTELSAIIFNLIDNAARETTKVSGNTVEVRSEILAGQLSIAVGNACDPSLSGAIMPTKHDASNYADEHGWGLRIVEFICEKHQGFCSFEAEKGVFTSICMIPLS